MAAAQSYTGCAAVTGAALHGINGMANRAGTFSVARVRIASVSRPQQLRAPSSTAVELAEWGGACGTEAIALSAARSAEKKRTKRKKGKNGKTGKRKKRKEEKKERKKRKEEKKEKGKRSKEKKEKKEKGKKKRKRIRERNKIKNRGQPVSM